MVAAQLWTDALEAYVKGLKKPVMFLVNAFVDPDPTSEAGPRFSGNPAGVCFAPNEFSDKEKQLVAMEMNQAETSFITSSTAHGGDALLRWFTPMREIELCGHATLGGVAALLDCLDDASFDVKDCKFTFGTMCAGLLEVQAVSASSFDAQAKEKRLRHLQMDFPSAPVVPVDAPAGLLESLSLSGNDAHKVVFVGKATYDYVVEVASEEVLLAVAPSFAALGEISARGVIVTCRHTSGKFNRINMDVAFLSRGFFPSCGINEDPVTGSAHCALAPYWAAKLGQRELWGYQASRRGGYVHVTDAGDRTVLRGYAFTFLKGELNA